MKRDELYPLGEFSEFSVHELPNYNGKSDYKNAIDKIEQLLPDVERIIHLTYYTSFQTRMLALGDLGIGLVTCKLGQRVPKKLIASLQVLANTVGIVPRDNFPSYITYNPTQALRTYTGNANEKNFILHIQKSQKAMATIIRELLLLQENPVKNNRLHILQSTSQSIGILKKETSLVHKDVDPTFFFQMFRKYFFPIEIGKGTYSSPSAVHLPELILIDIITGCADEKRLQMIPDFYPYLEPIYKLHIQCALQNPSLKESYIKNNLNNNFEKELNLLNQIFDNLVYFRLTHQGVVTRYIRRQDANVQFGTGGFPFDTFLQELITMGQEAKIQI